MQHSVSNSVSFYCRVSDTVQWGRKKMYQYIRAYCLNIYTYCGKGGKRNHFCLNLLSIKLIFVHPSMPGKHIMISSIGFFFSCPSSFHPPIWLKTRQARSSITEPKPFWSQIWIFTEMITKNTPYSRTDHRCALLLNEGIPRAYPGKKLRLKNILFFSL